MAVDTLKLYDRFRKAGLSDAVAKVLAETFKEISDDRLARLAKEENIKREIRELELASRK